ncbi:hypothetical protein [uncultured Helicobacter sp.]
MQILNIAKSPNTQSSQDSQKQSVESSALAESSPMDSESRET